MSRRLAQGGAPAAAFQALPRLRRPTLQARLQTLFQARHPGHQLDVKLRPLPCLGSWIGRDIVSRSGMDSARHVRGRPWREGSQDGSVEPI